MKIANIGFLILAAGVLPSCTQESVSSGTSSVETKANPERSPEPVSSQTSEVIRAFDNACLMNLPNFVGFDRGAQASGLESSGGNTPHFRHPEQDWFLSSNKTMVGNTCSVRLVSDNPGPLWPNILQIAEQRTGGVAQQISVPARYENAVRLANGSVLYYTTRISNNTADGLEHKINNIGITPPVSDAMASKYLNN